jgi:hypothetical protein
MPLPIPCGHSVILRSSEGRATASEGKAQPRLSPANLSRHTIRACGPQRIDVPQQAGCRPAQGVRGLQAARVWIEANLLAGPGPTGTLTDVLKPGSEPALVKCLVFDRAGHSLRLDPGLASAGFPRVLLAAQFLTPSNR